MPVRIRPSPPSSKNAAGTLRFRRVPLLRCLDILLASRLPHASPYPVRAVTAVPFSIRPIHAPPMPSGSNDSMIVIHTTPGIRGQVQPAVVGHVGLLRDGLATSREDLAGRHLRRPWRSCRWRPG
jgi:hypothetical protein